MVVLCIIDYSVLFLDLKKIIVVYVIKYNTCYVLFWGEGGFVDFVFSHVTFIGCFFVYNTVIIRLCNIV